MSIISAIIGSVAASGGPSKTVTWGGIDLEPVLEGVQNHATVNFTNWDNSTVYWTVVGTSNTYIGAQLVSYNGTLNPGSGDSTQDIYFTFNADQNTDGPLTYYVNIGSSIGNYDLGIGGPFTCRDSSQTPILVLDVDPASLGTMFGLTGWTDASGQGNDLYIINGATSSDNGKVLVLSGSGAYVNDSNNNNLTNATYGTITLSAWIKPTAVTGSTQTIIAKELCYKLRINSDGTLTLGTAKGYSPWEVTATVGAGAVTTSTWSHVVATVDAAYTRIYVNGVKVTETSGNIIGANSQPFNIGSYNNNSDFFGGRMGEVKVWNYALTASDVAAEYNSTAARYGQTLVPQGLLFNGTRYQELYINGSPGDWALGTNGTIEWWQKTSKNSNDFGGNFNGGMIVQGNAGGQNGIDIFNAGGVIDIGLGAGGVQPYVTEPSTGTWVHVAISFATNPGNTNVGLNHVYFNGVEQSLNNTSVRLLNSTDTLRVGNRVPGANYQNWTGQISNLHISTATLYTSTFTPMIRTTATTGTVLLLDYYDPTVDLSYYELNELSASATNGTNLYFSTSTYPDLINQIQVGNRITSTSTSTIGTVTGPVILADPANWGVPVTNLPDPGPYNFSGARHTTTGTVTLSADAPHALLGMMNQTAGGAFGMAIFNLERGINNVPVGAQITSNLWSGFKTVTNSYSWVGGSWAIDYNASDLVGETSLSDTYNFYW